MASTGKVGGVVLGGRAPRCGLSAGLDLILQRDAKRKGLAERPRPAPPEGRAEPGAPYIPAAVKREVWERDGGCCQWPVDSGGVCGSRLRLQFDHRVSGAEGGPSVAANLRILCARHHLLAARERLESRLMDRYCRDLRQVEPYGGANPNPNLDLNPCGPALGPGPSPPGP